MDSNKSLFNLYDFCAPFDENELIVSYKGPFTPAILSEIGTYITDGVSLGKNMARKVFKVFMEMALNTSFYSSEVNRIGFNGKQPKVGAFVICDRKDHLELVSGNLVKSDHVEELIKRCNLINSLKREELRKYKIEQRKLPPLGVGGGNIGLITVALTSKNPLDFEVKKVDESFSFFTLAVTLNK